MSTTTHPDPAAGVQTIALDLIDVGANVRDLDPEHVAALAASIALRGLIVPLAVRPTTEGRYELVAGGHRHVACEKAGLDCVPAYVREVGQVSGDQAAENILRKALTPLEEARAVERMLSDGYTLDGAAQVLGWSKRLVTARARILELPAAAQHLVGTGEIPVSAIDALLEVRAVSGPLCDLVSQTIAEQCKQGNPLGDSLARDPGWVVGQALRHGAGDVFAASLTGPLYLQDVDALKLGKKTQARYVEACELHDSLDRYAYGPPPVRFTDTDADQARAAGVLLELGRTQLVVDRGVYRELARAAVTRTVEDLRARQESKAHAKSAARKPVRERTPREQLDAEHRAHAREFQTRAHGVNLDLGAALLDGLASVDPASMDVARFFAYGLLGPDTSSYLGGGDHAARTIAANGIRLVLAEHRSTDTPILKSGEPGQTKVTYTDPEVAARWLWKFVDGAKSAGELYGRTLVVFAAQHYAHQLALPTSQRRGSALPASRKDAARKALEKVVKQVLPASHRDLTRAIEREAREYRTRQVELSNRTSGGATPPDGEDLDAGGQGEAVDDHRSQDEILHEDQAD